MAITAVEAVIVLREYMATRSTEETEVRAHELFLLCPGYTLGLCLLTPKSHQ